MSAVSIVLSRLPDAKPTGTDRWRCACPAHGGSNKSTLSIGVADNGAVLLRCWNGCSIEQIVGALGLELSDLFPDKAGPPGSGAVPSKLRLPAARALEILNRESLLIYVVASDMHAQKSVNETDFDRLAVAVRRIGQIVEATQ